VTASRLLDGTLLDHASAVAPVWTCIRRPLYARSNYAIYFAAIAALALIADDIPQPTNLNDEVRRVLFTLAGVGIAVLVMWLAHQLQKTRQQDRAFSGRNVDGSLRPRMRSAAASSSPPLSASRAVAVISEPDETRVRLTAKREEVLFGICRVRPLTVPVEQQRSTAVGPRSRACGQASPGIPSA
jgi:hypothetical protein